MKRLLLSLSLSAFLLSGCTKTGSDGTDEKDNCDAINAVKITATRKVVTVGESFELIAPEVPGYRTYDWFGPNNLNTLAGSNRISVPQAVLASEGMYHLFVNGLEGRRCQKRDSVYIDVQLKQESPACTIAANTATYSNLGNDQYNSVVRQFNPSTGLLQLAANQLFVSELTVQFHPRFKTVEPEDGLYYTKNSPGFDGTDEWNQVYISGVKQNQFRVAGPYQKVIMSHVNGKLQIRTCGVDFGTSKLSLHLLQP